jgi:hypothetical protein
MAKKKAPRPRLGYAIVMENGWIDEVSLRRKDFSGLLPGEYVAKVMISPAPIKKPRSKKNNGHR